MSTRKLSLLLFVIALGAGLAWSARQEGRSPDADWPMYNRDLMGTRFSPLDQVTPGNVAGLEQVWHYRFNRPDRDPITGPSSFELYQQITPIVVDGVMYTTSGDRVVALRPETGLEIWVHELGDGRIASPRGLSYWPGDGDIPARIFFTTGHDLVALNAFSGEPASSFGDNGEIALEIPYMGAPLVYRNRVILGSNAFGPGELHIGPALAEPRGPDGDIQGFDAVTGERVWRYETIPGPGEPGHETWGNDSWQNRTGNNVWTFALTLDEEAGIVYLPVSSPGANYYGGDRPGNNEPANSVLALDAGTGEYRWHFQVIHHELWDYNLPPAPALLDLEIDGETIPALAQTGKMGWMFILNRLTGEPVFGVEEVPVPAGDVPGEWYSPTQPMPLKPGPVARVGFDPETDMVTPADTNESHAAACRERWEEVGYYTAGPYTPFNLEAEGTPPTLLFPTLTGGVNWGGIAVDPTTNYIFVNSKDEASVGWTIPNPRYNEDTSGEQVPYTRGGGPGFTAPRGDGTNGSWPCHKPPWASLMAIDGDSGEFVWRVPLGINPTLPEGRQNVGSPGYGGPIATAGGLVFIGATGDSTFRAFDSATGEQVWAFELPYNITAVPISYEGSDGRQYVAVTSARAAGGGGGGGRGGGAPRNEGLFVFALPE
jgi:quinoprotein glucose dehydrogenase